MDLGLRDIGALFVVAHQASPAGEPCEGAFDDPAARHDLEAGLVVDPEGDFNDEVEEGRLVHELRYEDKSDSNFLTLC